MLLGGVLLAAGPAPYSENFDKLPLGKLPATFQVLDGDFTVRDFDGSRCLELAGDPIGGFGVLLPTSESIGCEVSARIWAAPSGKRFPEFGVGANGAGGTKLMLTPGVNEIALRVGDDTIATAPFAWKASSWTNVQLQVWTHDGKWFARGKSWNAGAAEPGGWMIESPLAKTPRAGRASVWGSDYSEQPIRFDDISVTAE